MSPDETTPDDLAWSQADDAILSAATVVLNLKHQSGLVVRAVVVYEFSDEFGNTHMDFQQTRGMGLTDVAGFAQYVNSVALNMLFRS